jgi:hypothetical protein
MHMHAGMPMGEMAYPQFHNGIPAYTYMGEHATQRVQQQRQMHMQNVMNAQIHTPNIPMHAQMYAPNMPTNMTPFGMIPHMMHHNVHVHGMNLNMHGVTQPGTVTGYAPDGTLVTLSTHPPAHVNQQLQHSQTSETIQQQTQQSLQPATSLGGGQTAVRSLALAAQNGSVAVSSPTAEAEQHRLAAEQITSNRTGRPQTILQVAAGGATAAALASATAAANEA